MGTTDLFLLTALCLGVAEAGTTTSLLYGRLLGPQSHVTISADVSIRNVGPLQRTTLSTARFGCLAISVDPPRFRYALPTLSELHLPSKFGHRNCSDDATVRSIVQDIDLSPTAFQRSLCEASANLVKVLSNGPGHVVVTKCVEEAWHGRQSARGVVMEGLQGGQLVTASLQFLQDRPADGTAPGRDRRSSDDEQEALQKCVASSHQIAVPADAAGDVILVLGTTGVGKSTVVQLLTNQEDTLYSNETTKGEFTIWDSQDKIGSGVKSKTSVPELVTDPASGANFYDFPGFSDTRGPCADIVTASVLRKVAQSARSVKVVFVIAYHSAHKGSDRLGFINLLRHATDFMPALHKYKDSVALVVTKVPNTRRRLQGKYSLVSDGEVRGAVASFLREVIVALDEMRKNDSGAALAFYPAATMLVQALLQRDEASKEFDRIGLFRKPDKAGRLVDVVLLRDTKYQLQNMVYSSVTPTAPVQGDFGLPLSAAAQQQVVKMAGNFAGHLQSHVNRIAQALRMHYQLRRRRALDLDAVRNQTVDDARHLESALHVVVEGLAEGEGRTPRAFLRRLRDAVLAVHANAPAEGFRASLNDTALLEFLQDASEDKLQYQPDEWARPLQQLLKDLQRVALWYDTLADLDVALSEPGVQRKRGRLLERLGTQEAPTSMEDSTLSDGSVSENLVDTELQPAQLEGRDLILAAMEALNVAAKREEVSQIQPDEAMSQDLRMLLDAALRPEQLQSTCETDEFGHYCSLFLRGHFVWMHEVVQQVKNGCKNKIRAVYILAQHTVFVDEDLYLHDIKSVAPPAQLFIGAPRWYVEGKRTLSVDGLAGQAHDPHPDHSGRHGNAGLPGGPAGAIMAVGADFVNVRKLTLRASGGKGGPGQDGASGRGGNNGRDPPMYSVHAKSPQWGVPPLWGGMEGDSEGQTAAEGSNGGDGGVGGLGGRPGKLLPLQMSGLELPLLVSDPGAPGSTGTGGRGGKGGVHGATVRKEVSYFLFFPYDSKTTTIGNGQAEDGKRGTDGKSTLQLQQPQEPPPLECIEHYLRRMSKGALGALWDRVRGGAARRFLKQIEDWHTATHSDSSCGLPALVHNLADLEVARWQHRQDFGSSQRLVPQYEALLRRWGYVSRQIESPSTRKRKALLTSRAALLSTLRALRSPARTELVVDVREYLKLAERTMQALDEHRRVRAVRAALSDARGIIASRMDERRRLLQEHVQPALHNALQRLQETVSALPRELEVEQRSVAESQRHLQEHARRLEDAKFRTRTVGFLTGLFKSVVGLFTGTEVITAATALVGAAAEKEDLEEDEPVALPSGEGFGLKETIMLVQSAKSAFDAVMDIEKEGNGTHNEFPEMLSKIKKLISAVTSKDGMQRELPQNHTGHSASTLLALKEEALLQRESWLRAAEHTVHSRVMPLLNAMDTDLNGLYDTHNSTSTRFARALQARLGDVRVALTPLTTSSSSLAIPREIAVCAELLHESLGALISLMDQMDELRERQDMASAMGRMAQALAARGAPDDWQEEDPPELASALLRLQDTVSSNLVLEEYHVALHSFKQWAFPFIMEYQIDEEVPNGNFTFQGAVDRAQFGLSELLNKLQKYHTVVRPYDQYISTQNFVEPSPLYSWGPAENGAELESLLEGNEVVLWADVLRDPDMEDAIKFNRIGVRLIATNASRQAELDKAFEPLSVKMTHLGESYFKCGSKVFVLSLQSQEITFSAKRKADGAPLETNKVYDKINRGDMMLSPFTLWKIELKGLQPSSESILSTFKGEVRLVLEGNAQYVKGYTCDESLDEFYSFEPSKAPLSTIVI